jgi:hypothetical protein
VRGTVRVLAFASVIALASAGAASAAVVVQNGSFSTTTSTDPGRTTGQIGSFSNENIAETDWTVASDSYFFVFNPSTVNSPGSLGGPLAGDDNVALYSPTGASPDGGNFIGADPDYHNGAISQTISGLTSGDTYMVSFYYAGAQQVGYSGPTTEGWAVSLGGQTDYTGGNPNGNLSDPSHGFTGWQTADLTFTASSGSEVLSFLATGTGGATLPPFALLDGVSISQCPPGVPEPATWAMMLLGLGGLGGALRARRQQQLAAA